MMNVNEILKQRNLPELINREEMKKMLLDNEYGYIPDTKYSVNVSEPKFIERRYLAGKVHHSVVNMNVKSEYGEHSFPINMMLHNDGIKRPFFVFLNFSSSVPDMYYPAEEISDEGFDVLSVCYKDVTSDDDDFSNGIAKVLLPNGQETETTCGKIMLWAWAASRILDYAQTINTLDITKAAVIGHSRLGKTALVTSLMDERFMFAISNCSGNSGAALARNTSGETIKDIVDVFPYWFCKKYSSFAEENFAPMFDQHYLIASIAPRYVYVASASLDTWADPVSEFLTCVSASKMYNEMGYSGLVHKGNLPEVGEPLHQGRIGYYNHYGMHFLSRNTWKKVIEYINLHTK